MTRGPVDIESTTNRRAKGWAALSKRVERDRTGEFLIEGRRETERAIDRIALAEVIWCPEYGDPPASGALAPTTVSKRVFDKISRRQNPDGIAAVARTPDLTIGSFTPRAPLLVLVADGIEKPGNIGAMLRTCDAFGAAFLASALGTDLVNPNVVRSAQGSLYTTPVASLSRADAIEWCVEHTAIVVAHTTGEDDLWQRDFTGPTTIVIGAEHSGVDGEWFAVGTPALIPMTGVADSLNASVSAGVFLSEAARQRSL